jgi:hypothetical protein
VPLQGSFWLLFGMSLIYLLTTLGLGLFVSTISHTQQQAMMTSTFFFLIPMMYLSGFVFPIENMPDALQPFTYLIPLRYFVVILRGIFLKGVGLETLWPQALALFAWGPVLTRSCDRASGWHEHDEHAQTLKSADLLETISRDGTVWEGVPAEDRERLLRAVALVYSPDRAERRRLVKMAERGRKAQRVKQDEAVRSVTGIRALRQRPLFHTPNVFPPEEFDQREVEDETVAFGATTAELQHCYVCKEKYTQVHHFYDRWSSVRGELETHGLTFGAGRRFSPEGGSRSGIRRASNCCGREPMSS